VRRNSCPGRTEDDEVRRFICKEKKRGHSEKRKLLEKEEGEEKLGFKRKGDIQAVEMEQKMKGDMQDNEGRDKSAG
jgi:hypothetical protein